jgi:hypothetical protein
MKAMKNELTVLSNTFANIPQNVVPNENAQHPIVCSRQAKPTNPSTVYHVGHVGGLHLCQSEPEQLIMCLKDSDESNSIT